MSAKVPGCEPCRGPAPARERDRERFVEREADERRREVVARLRGLKFESPSEGTTLDILRDLRT